MKEMAWYLIVVTSIFSLTVLAVIAETTPRVICKQDKSVQHPKDAKLCEK